MRLKQIVNKPLISFIITIALFLVASNGLIRESGWHRNNELIMKELLPLLPELKSEGKINSNLFDHIEISKEHRDSYGPFGLNIMLISIFSLLLGSWIKAHPCWSYDHLKNSIDEGKKLNQQADNK